MVTPGCLHLYGPEAVEAHDEEGEPGLEEETEATEEAEQSPHPPTVEEIPRQRIQCLNLGFISLLGCFNH